MTHGEYSIILSSETSFQLIFSEATEKKDAHKSDVQPVENQNTTPTAETKTEKQNADIEIVTQGRSFYRVHEFNLFPLFNSKLKKIALEIV